MMKEGEVYTVSHIAIDGTVVQDQEATVTKDKAGNLMLLIMKPVAMLLGESIKITPGGLAKE